MQKSFLAIQTDKGIVKVVHIDELPDILRGAFYEEQFDLFLDGAHYWTTEQVALARQLAEAITVTVASGVESH
jgi:hypothetical protein